MRERIARALLLFAAAVLSSLSLALCTDLLLSSFYIPVEVSNTMSTFFFAAVIAGFISLFVSGFSEDNKSMKRVAVVAGLFYVLMPLYAQG